MLYPDAQVRIEIWTKFLLRASKKTSSIIPRLKIARDEKYAKVLNELKSGNCRKIIWDLFVIRNGILFRRKEIGEEQWLLCIPDNLLDELCEKVHDASSCSHCCQPLVFSGSKFIFCCLKGTAYGDEIGE
ncbi:hypothetical protein PR048_025980 [Dryococelus australis]|uniref:Uncharacterized protein n=1 Tax=Dryococelus australis TaxID=614101 RepID=A0ABQ9GK12_9NEOP|nr:hypothetical protein PR048_025980 [Dryococelus australis]